VALPGQCHHHEPPIITTVAIHAIMSPSASDTIRTALPSPLRTALFVPASRIDRIPKALASGADAVIVDLEDAVVADSKNTARAALDVFLTDHPDARVLIRINDATTRWHEQDLALCRKHDNVLGLLLPKTESAAQAQQAAATARAVIPIIESAAGLLDLAAIAAVPGVACLAFGSLDLALDLNLHTGTPGTQTILDQARYQILLHSRAAQLAAPIDGVFQDIGNPDALKNVAARSREMGFGGMLLIHPAQVAPVHAAFAPGEAELAWARRVIEAAAQSQAGAFSLDGKMIDAPVILRARLMVSQAEN